MPKTLQNVNITTKYIFNVQKFYLQGSSALGITSLKNGGGDSQDSSFSLYEAPSWPTGSFDAVFAKT